MKILDNDSDAKFAVNEVNTSGGFVFKNFINSAEVDQINTYLDRAGSTYKQLYFDAPWGYGNILDVECASPVIKNNWFERFANEFFCSDFRLNHLVCNEKTPFVGYEVEWHQEVFNIETFAPGCDQKLAHDLFVQVFIALDEQGPENGGLLVVPGSNNLGVLKSIDVLSPALTHKRSVSQADMKRATSVCSPVVCPELQPGDALVFSPLLVHGSVRNISNERRRSLVMQAASTRVPERDETVYEVEKNRRQNFVIETLQGQINKLKKMDLYNELKREKS
ncbi:phytanoyl-CoA dioxygenase family protein [Alphaproteobacteria bacterium]|nr:phytanoyl-CoA dioxygenase family protein [Alphaproteobacteria bacterium]